jgi:hypothetical protein
MTLYISGRITGDADYESKFYKAQRLLHEAGYGAINPCYLVSESSWTYAMMNGYQRLLADLTAFLDRSAKGEF